MSRILDYIVLTIAVFLLTLVWSSLLFDKWVYPILISCALTSIAVITLWYITKAKGKPYSYDRLALELSVKGSKYLINIVKSILKNDNFENGENYLLLQDSMIVAAFRFSPLGLNDLGNILTLALEKKRKRIFVLARGIDRKAASIISTSEVRLTVVRIRAIFRFLKKNNALPDLKPQKKKFSFSMFIDGIFQRTNTKNYMFSGALLIAVAFLTPLKIYYLVFGSISLLMAILTLTPLGKGSFGSEKLFENLSANNTHSDSNDEFTHDK